jgi:Na+-driven multidrug efflux pump
LVTYLLLLIFGLFFTKTYFTWQTADTKISRPGAEYLSICMVLSFGSVGQVILQRILQSTGKTALSMISQLTGAVINIVLDPILILGLFGFPRMEVAGAAIATVFGQIVAMGIAIYFNLAKNKEVHFRFKGFRPDKKMIAEIYKISAPAIVMQALNSLMALGVNLILTPYSDNDIIYGDQPGLYFAAFSIIAQGIFQALGNAVYSLIITLLRVAIFLLPTLYVFVKFLSTQSVWWAFPLSEVASSCISALFLKRIYTQKIVHIAE